MYRINILVFYFLIESTLVHLTSQDIVALMEVMMPGPAELLKWLIMELMNGMQPVLDNILI